MKSVFTLGALVTSGVLASFACSQPTEAPLAPVAHESSALGGIQSCQSLAASCSSAATSAADLAACGQQLHACLEALVADAGLPSFGSFDGGSFLPPGSFFDGSLPPIGFLDDGGLPTFLDDGGLPPIAIPDASAATSCVETLQSCLSSANSDPQTCATQAVTCLEQAI